MKLNSIGANYAGNYAQLGIAKRQTKSNNIIAPRINTDQEGDTVSFKGGVPNYPKRFRNAMGIGGTLASLGISALVDNIPFLLIGVPTAVIIGVLSFIAGDYLGNDLDNKIDNLSKSEPDKKVAEEILEEIEDEDGEIKEHSDY